MISKREGFGLRVFLMSVFLVALLSLGVFALGAATRSSYAPVNEGEEVCVVYDVFNSPDNDLSVEITAHNGLTDLELTTPSSTFIPAGSTLDSGAVPIEVCFQAPDNLFDGACTQQSKKYIGYVLISEVAENNIDSSGSVASFAISSGLTVDVLCVPEGGDGSDRNNFYLLALIFVIVIIIILLFVRRRQSGMASLKR
jgi:hypothetical protein